MGTKEYVGGILAALMVCVISYKSYPARLHELLESGEPSQFEILSSVADLNAYRDAFRNQMESDKASQIADYNLYKQKFRNDMQSNAAPSLVLRAPQMILAESVTPFIHSNFLVIHWP